MKVLLIIPAHNEADSLPSLIRDIRSCAAHYDVVVVDDASTDDTARVAQQLGVPVLRLAANLGIGGAVQTGFKYAERNNYDIAVQVDGDGQHDPAWLETLIQPIRQGEADCVIGSRYTHAAPDVAYKTPFPRRVGMYCSTGVLFLATGLHVTDTTSGFRALARPVLEYFARSYPVDHPEAETLLMLHRAGFRILEVPVRMRGRTSGESLFTFTKACLYPLRVVIGFAGLLFQRRRPAR
jgi:glycosyltransferase involved in cell wall biosynthesis